MHSDLKLSNILIHIDGSIKLSDFGISKKFHFFFVFKNFYRFLENQDENPQDNNLTPTVTSN